MSWELLIQIGKALSNTPKLISLVINVSRQIPADLHPHLSVALLTSLILPYFSKKTSIFAHIKGQIKAFSKYLKVQNALTQGKFQVATHKLVNCIKKSIEELLTQSLKKPQIFTLLMCSELFQKIQKFPLDLLASAVKNCFSRAFQLENSDNFPSYYSLFCNTTEPFLPSYSHRDYTLVLDLDETLGHFDSTTFKLRPFVDRFLLQMSVHYELVLFTAATRKYADWAMETADPNGLVHLRLYREHTLNSEVKDLERLGRNLEKVVIIDNFKKSFIKQPMNGVEITSWIGDENDNELMRIAEVIAEIPGKKKNLQETVALVNKMLKC